MSERHSNLIWYTVYRCTAKMATMGRTSWDNMVNDETDLFSNKEGKQVASEMCLRTQSHFSTDAKSVGGGWFIIEWIASGPV